MGQIRILAIRMIAQSADAMVRIAISNIHVNYPKVCNKPRALNRYKNRISWRLTIAVGNLEKRSA